MAIKNNAKEFPSLYSCRFLKDGLVSYEDSGSGINLIKKETIDRMLNSFIGKPVVIKHMEVTPGNFQEVAVGYITDLYFNSQDGWHWSKFLLINDKAKELIQHGYSVSCAYHVNKFGPGGENHAIRYENEILEGEGEHLALVPNPRYEECGVPHLVLNSKGARYANSETLTNALDREVSIPRNLLTSDNEAELRAAGFENVGVGGGTAEFKIRGMSESTAMAKIKEILGTVRGADIYSVENSKVDHEDPKAKDMFAKEKGEHPEFSDEDIWKIVEDHMKKENAVAQYAEKIMQIVGAILDRYNLQSGVDLVKHEDEFLQAVRSAGITSISQEDADELEDQNYHTALEILMRKGFLRKSRRAENANDNPYSKDNLELRIKTLKESIKSMADTNPDKKETEEEIKELEEKLSKTNTKGAGGMAETFKEKVLKALNNLGVILNGAFEGKETTEEEAAEAKKKEEEEAKENSRKNRAKACGLAENASEEDITKKEEELKVEKQNAEAEAKKKEEEEVKKENAKKEAGLKHFKALNALRETGELSEDLNMVPGNTQAEKMARGKERYGAAKK